MPSDNNGKKTPDKPAMMPCDDREKHQVKVGGAEVGHLMEDAEDWWDATGRHFFLHRNFSDDMKTQQVALNATNPLHTNYIGGASGILLGVQWEQLTPAERQRVLTAYTAHHCVLVV